MWHLILWDTKIWYGNKNFFASEFLILKIYPINEVKNFLHHFLNINYVELEKKNSKYIKIYVQIKKAFLKIKKVVWVNINFLFIGCKK